MLLKKIAIKPRIYAVVLIAIKLWELIKKLFEYEDVKRLLTFTDKTILYTTPPIEKNKKLKDKINPVIYSEKNIAGSVIEKHINWYENIFFVE